MTFPLRHTQHSAILDDIIHKRFFDQQKKSAQRIRQRAALFEKMSFPLKINRFDVQRSTKNYAAWSFQPVYFLFPNIIENKIKAMQNCIKESLIKDEEGGGETTWIMR